MEKGEERQASINTIASMAGTSEAAAAYAVDHYADQGPIQHQIARAFERGAASVLEALPDPPSRVST